MTKRIFILLAIFLVCGAVVILVFHRRHQPIVHQGRQLGSWSAQTYQAPDQRVRDQAITVLREIGTNAVPPLIQDLEARESVLTRAALVVAADLPPALADKLRANVHPINTNELHAIAARSLGMLGANAGAAAPALAETLQHPDPTVRTESAIALGRIGPAAVPQLITALSSTNAEVRHMAAYALGEVGPASLAAVPALLVALGDTNEYVRSSASYSLIQLGSPIIPDLEKIVKQENGRRQRTAALTLARLHPGPGVLTNAILPLLASPDPETRLGAIQALSAAGSFSRPIIATFVSALEDSDLSVRLAATKAVAGTYRKVETAIPALTKGLVDADPGLRESSALTLGNFGAVASSAIPSLNALLQDQSEAVRTAAKTALEQINESLAKTNAK